MFRDVVFEEIYAPMVQQNMQSAFEQGLSQGRQNGWNELFNAVMHLQYQNLPITQENITALINQMLEQQS